MVRVGGLLHSATGCLGRPARVREPTTRDVLTDAAKIRTGFNVVAAAPTGAAAQRLRLGLELSHPHPTDRDAGGLPVEVPVTVQRWRADAAPVGDHLEMGGCFIGTLHSFLGYRGTHGGRGVYVAPPKAPTVVVVDETSMVDEEPFARLMAWAAACLDDGVPVQVVLVGDPDQLAPVGVGFPFRDLVAGPHGAFVPTARLTEVRRQGEGSVVVEASRRIARRELPPSPADVAASGRDPWRVDGCWMTPSALASATGADPTNAVALVESYETFLRKHGHVADGEDPEVQLLLALRNQSRAEPEAVYADRANAELQEHHAARLGRVFHTYQATSDSGFTRSVRFFRGDRVEHRGDNGYDPHNTVDNSGVPDEVVMRGSVGRVVACHEWGVEVEYPFLDRPTPYRAGNDIDGLRLAYAITVHSAQGSECPFVLFALPERGGRPIVDRPLVYTGVTRSRAHCQLLVSSRRLAEAVALDHGVGRLTLLP